MLVVVGGYVGCFLRLVGGGGVDEELFLSVVIVYVFYCWGGWVGGWLVRVRGGFGVVGWFVWEYG